MSGESLASFIMPLLFLLLFFVAGRKKKPQGEPSLPSIPKKETRPMLRKAPPVAPLQPKEQRPIASKRDTSYEVERKQRSTPILSKDWNRKSSLQQAFVLSEVLKRIDE